MKGMCMNTSLTSNNLLFFDYEDKKIRVINVENNLFWVAKDVCDLLGYKNATDAVSNHCRDGVAKYYPIIDALGRTQDVRIITEPDLYRLITSSTLPEAIKFERWVFEEILPQIRRTGTYNSSALINQDVIDNRMNNLERGLAEIAQQIDTKIQSLTNLMTISLPKDKPVKKYERALRAERNKIAQLKHQISLMENMRSCGLSSVRCSATDLRRANLMIDLIELETGDRISQSVLTNRALTAYFKTITTKNINENKPEKQQDSLQVQ